MKHKKMRVMTAGLCAALLVTACSLLPGTLSRADEIGVDIGVVTYGDINGDDNFDLKDISALFRMAGCEYEDRLDYNSDGVISLKDAAILYQDWCVR